MRNTVVLAASVLMVVGCESSQSVSTRAASVSGSVVDETGRPIGGTTVTVFSAVGQSDDAGLYSLTYSGQGNEYVVVNFKAPGYPQASRRVQMPDNGQVIVDVSLRPIDQQSYFMLPTGNQNIVFNVNHTGAGAVLTIPGDSLVDPNGNLATGAASIEMTFWSPADVSSTYPGILRASNRAGEPQDDSPINLLTYGMVAIDIYQNSNRLQVAPSKMLNLTIQTTGQRRDAIANRPASVRTWPSLWTLNPNSGLWDEDVGDSTFDATTGQLVSVLRHLSTKNADEPDSGTLGGPNSGVTGCYQGRVTGACGQPISGAQVKVNLVYDFAGSTGANEFINSDANGLYKFNWQSGAHSNYFHSAQWTDSSGVTHTTDLNSSPLPPTLIEKSQTGPGVTPSSPRVVADAITCSNISGVCAPNTPCGCFNDPSDPGGCMEALEASDPNVVNGYNPCWVAPLGSNWLGPCYDGLLTGDTTDWHFNTVWNYWQPGTLCENCWPLVDLVFKDVAGDQSSGCTGQGTYGTGCCPVAPAPGTYNICDDLAATHRTVIGQPCVAGVDTCCEDAQSGPVPLQCIDHVCVPQVDPDAIVP